MLDKINEIRNILNEINKTPIGEPFFSDPRYKAKPFDKANFKAINDGEPVCLCFVDGGNQEILGAPNLSIQFVRVHANCFEGRTRVKMRETSEFLSVATSEGKNNKIMFKAKLIPLKGELLLQREGELELDSTDAALQGAQGPHISAVGGLVRRFAEWALAGKMLGKLDDGDAAVMDGTLQTSVMREAFHANKAFEAAKEKKVTLTALSKTCTLFTSTGLPLATAIQRMAPQGKWRYYPVCENRQPDHQAEIYFVKLHDKSSHAFRFEVFREQQAAPELFSSLVENSTDPCFLGYPYGLVDADRQARVTNREAQAMKALIGAKLGKDFEGLASATDAHSVLDGI